MCGIAGYYQSPLSQSVENIEKHQNIIQSMIQSLHHRGPDHGNFWCDNTSPVNLGHRRLSIIDLSQSGHQPMHSKSERYTLVYNGEIYNFSDLRQNLRQQGITFNGHSDTEVLLAAIEIWGLNATLHKIDGMFAFALWDKQEQTLHFARDRFGKKPLYIGWAGNALIFASELKSLHAYPEFKAEICDIARHIYHHYGYITAPYSIFKGVWQLKPAHSLSIPIHETQPNTDLSQDMTPYWVLPARTDNHISDIQSVISEFSALLTHSVKTRMMSDVPLGSFLSGGIDSSLVTAIMQANSPQAIKSFTIGFEEKAYNEARYAKEIANYLGTDHQEHIISSDEAIQIIPNLAHIYDEPFADSSQIPSYLVSKMASSHALSLIHI